MPAKGAGRAFDTSLAAQQSLRLVYLGGHSTHRHAARLLDAGVPAVMSIIPDAAGTEDEWPALWFAEQFYLGLAGGATLVQSYQAALLERIALYGSQGAWPLLQARDDYVGSWRFWMAEEAEAPWHVPFVPRSSVRSLLRNQGRLHEALADRGYVGLRGMASGTIWAEQSPTLAAAQYLQEFGASYTGGVFWLDGAAWEGEQDAQKAGLRTWWNNTWSEQQTHAVAAYLRTHENCLLVLDNIREQAPVHAVLTTLLPPDGSCRLLVTTTQRDLPGLTMIDMEEMSTVQEQSGLELYSIASQLVELERLPAPNTLTGAQIGQFVAALLAAYNREELTRMVRIRLEVNLDAIAGSADLSTVCFNLIGWAIRTGQLPLLIGAVREDKPGNPEVRDFIRAVGHDPNSL